MSVILSKQVFWSVRNPTMITGVVTEECAGMILEKMNDKYEPIVNIRQLCFHDELWISSIVTNRLRYIY